MQMLSRACQKAWHGTLPSKTSYLIQNRLSFTYHTTISGSRCSQQLAKAQPGCPRSFTTAQSPTDKLRRAINNAKQDHPVLLPTLLIASVASVCWLGLLSYDEYYREKPALGLFPPAVERHLRNAIWYTEIKPEPSFAANCFTKAIDQAEREGMDPFSPESTGIYIRFAAALEKFGQAKGSAEILDRLVNSLIGRIEDIDRGRGMPQKAKAGRSSPGEVEALQAKADSEASPEARETERRRLLKQAIECKVKISQLYESDYIQDMVSAKRVIDEAMKMLIEAMHDPRGLQFDQNRAGVSANEAAAMLSQVGGINFTLRDFRTALEVFKLALVAVRKASEGKPSCREAFVLSSMHSAGSMMLASPDPVIDDQPVTEASIQRARQTVADWARKSLQCAQAVPAAEYDELCPTAISTSCSGMASTLMELGDLEGARKMYEQVIQTSAVHPALKPMATTAQSALMEIDKKDNNPR